MRKFYIISIVVFSIFLCTSAAYSFDMSQVYAYPVPFIPGKHQQLTINTPGGATTIKCNVYDINGDIVRSFSGTIWNGRNGKGRQVKPGLYIIKVEIEDGSGNYGKKMIRIIVQ